MVDELGLSAEEVVRELYRSLLLREADETGLRNYATRLRDRSSALSDIVRRIVSSDEFRGKAQGLIYGTAIVRPERFTNDHSRHGEVGLLLKRLVNASAKHRVVVDVGARGRDGSNSYDFLRSFGWRGLLIDRDPAAIAGIQGDFAGCDFELVHCAIGDREGTVEIGSAATLKGAPDPAGSSGAAGAPTVHVPLLKLKTVLQAHKIPKDFDLLCVGVKDGGIPLMNEALGDGDFQPGLILLRRPSEAGAKSVEDLPLSEALRSRYRIAEQTLGSVILGPK